jgi:large subunit ribosomal protein L24
MALRIRKGDLVQVITGADKGKQGRVMAVDRAAGRVRVEKVRVQKRHLKPGRKAARTGGILEQEGFIDASNVRLVDPKTGKPDRVRVRVDGGRRMRVFAKSGDAVPAPAQI